MQHMLRTTDPKDIGILYMIATFAFFLIGGAMALLLYATVAIAALSMAVWAHHMYATGAVLLAFFSLTTFLIAIPTGIKFVNWIGTMWKGQITFEAPMLFACGFLVTFLFGGLTGVLLASPPLDFHLSDPYFVVAHFHYTLFRHDRVRHLRRHLLLVPEDDRPDDGRDPGQGALLAHVHRVPHHVPGAALGATRACPAATPTTCPPTGSPR